jgi:DNA-binding beta-propeller fold protein YncE
MESRFAVSMRASAVATVLVASLCAGTGFVAPARAEPSAGRKPPAATLAATSAPPPRQQPEPLRAIRVSPDGGGIGFDDLGFSAQLRKVLVPAGGLGKIGLVDPESVSVISLALGTATAYAGGHDDGITSVDSDGARLFATDRTSRRVLVANPTTGALIGSAPLTGHPDYVRWVASTRELWVAEPSEERIEIFSLRDEASLRPAGHVRVAGGPESLVVDDVGQRAFTHLWDGVTVAIDVHTRAILGKWPNGCRGSRGIAYVQGEGIVLAACAEGKLVALDANHGGRRLGSIRTGAGVDVIAYNPTLRHAYVPAAEAATLSVVGVSAKGELASLRVVPTAKGAHCVAADDRGHAWVCDPARGQLLLYTEPAP